MLPPKDARLGGIQVSDKAREAAAAGVAAVEKAKEKVKDAADAVTEAPKGEIKVKDLKDLGAAVKEAQLRAKEAEAATEEPISDEDADQSTRPKRWGLQATYSVV